MNKGLSIAALTLGGLVTLIGTAIVAISVVSLSRTKMEF